MLQATVVTAGTRDGFGSAAADLTELLAVPGDAVGQVDDVEDLGTAEAGDLHSTRGPEAMASPAAKSWVPPGEPEPRLPASRDAVRNGSAPIPFSGPTAAGPRGEAASETGSTGTWRPWPNARSLAVGTAQSPGRSHERDLGGGEGREDRWYANSVDSVDPIRAAVLELEAAALGGVLRGSR
jgi:hypothetical protein